MSEECPPDEVFALLDDEYARAILTAANTQPMSAKALSEECDASLRTVYRRVERLVACTLLEEGTQLDEDGHHYSVYNSRLDHLTVTLDEDELQVTIETKPPKTMADHLTDMWEELQ